MTMDRLKRKGFSLANRCSLCGRDEENIEHLLIHCPMTWGLWASMLAAMGIVRVPPLLVKDLIIGRNGVPFKKDERKVSFFFSRQSGRRETW